jgi:hypothetical protein
VCLDYGLRATKPSRSATRMACVPPWACFARPKTLRTRGKSCPFQGFAV